MILNGYFLQQQTKSLPNKLCLTYLGLFQMIGIQPICLKSLSLSLKAVVNVAFVEGRCVGNFVVMYPLDGVDVFKLLDNENIFMSF